MTFFWLEGQKIEKFDVLGEIFQFHTQTKDGWPDPTQPGSKIFDPDPPLVL